MVSAAYLAVSHDPLYDKLFAVGGGAALASIAFFGMPARRRSWRTLLAVVVFAALAAQGIGCGVKYGKPEPFTVTVTGTSGSISQTVAVKVTVVAP